MSGYFLAVIKIDRTWLYNWSLVLSERENMKDEKVKIERICPLWMKLEFGFGGGRIWRVEVEGEERG